MGIKKSIYHFSEKLYLDRFLVDSFFKIRQKTRSASGSQKKILQAYLRDCPQPKLHLGCGKHLLKGWLNTDLYPSQKKIFHLDATRNFPFNDEYFEYVFSEHMIEHISYHHGIHMLKECYRVLKVGGKIRVTTPDLSFLTGLYSNPETDLHQRYIAWALECFWDSSVADKPDAGYVVNHFVRSWGHQFIYDKTTLTNALRTAGFKNLTLCSLNNSEHQELRNLENQHRMPEGFLELESITFEAEK